MVRNAALQLIPDSKLGMAVWSIRVADRAARGNQVRSPHASATSAAGSMRRMHSLQASSPGTASDPQTVQALVQPRQAN